MFQNEDDFKTIVNRLNIDDKPNPGHRENLRGQMLSAFDKSGEESKTESRPLWRTIMKSPITKIATAAAVIIIVVLISIHQFAGSIDLAAPTFAQTIEAMKKMPWMHITMEFDVPQPNKIGSFWKCFDPPIEASQDVDGKTKYCDYNKEIMYVYNPEVNAITIGQTINKENLGWAKSPFDMISAIIDPMRYDSKISREEAKIDGVDVEIMHMHIISGGGDVTLIRDIKRNLLISMETEDTLPQMNKRITAKGIFDYPQQGPRNIYDLGVPKNAKIIDQRPRGDLKNLIANVQHQFNKGYGDHIAAVLESGVGKNGTLKPYHIRMMRKYGQLQRADTYFAAINSGTEPKSAVNLYEKAKNKWPDITWPNLTLEQVKKVESNEAIKNQQIFNGKDTTIRYYKAGEEKITSIHYPGKSGFYGEGRTMNWTSWVDLSTLSRGSRYREPKLKLLPPDPKREGLVGLEIYEPGIKNPIGNKGEKIIGATTDRYWFDPSRDYLLLEHEQEMEKGRFPADTNSRTLTLEVKQTSTGQWYPSHIRQERRFNNEHYLGQTTDKRIILDTEPVFEKNIFDPNYIFNAK